MKKKLTYSMAALAALLIVLLLAAHYSRYARHDWECCVERQSGGAIRAIEHGSLRFGADVSGDGFYIVYSWGDGVPLFRELDLRGH